MVSSYFVKAFFIDYVLLFLEINLGYLYGTIQYFNFIGALVYVLVYLINMVFEFYKISYNPRFYYGGMSLKVEDINRKQTNGDGTIAGNIILSLFLIHLVFLPFLYNSRLISRML